MSYQSHGIYPALYPCLNSTVHMFCPAGCLGLLPRHPKKSVFHKPPPSFPNPDRSDPWLLFHCYQTAAYHGVVSGPWGPPIAQPLCEVRKNQPQLYLVYSIYVCLVRSPFESHTSHFLYDQLCPYGPILRVTLELPILRKNLILPYLLDHLSLVKSSLLIFNMYV